MQVLILISRNPKLRNDGGGGGSGIYYLENCSELQFSTAIYYRGFGVFLSRFET